MVQSILFSNIFLACLLLLLSSLVASRVQAKSNANTRTNAHQQQRQQQQSFTSTVGETRRVSWRDLSLLDATYACVYAVLVVLLLSRGGMKPLSGGGPPVSL